MDPANPPATTTRALPRAHATTHPAAPTDAATRVALLPDGNGENQTGITRYSRELSHALARLDPAVGVGVQTRPTRKREVTFLGRQWGGHITQFWDTFMRRIEGYHVIHATHIMRLHRMASVLTVHDLVCFERPELYDRATVWMWRALKRRIGRLPAVVTPTRYIAGKVVDHLGVDPERVHAIHHGVNHRAFHADTPTRLSPEGARHVLFVGEWRHRKRQLEAIQALARVPDVQLHHAGPTLNHEGYRGLCAAEARRLGVPLTEWGYLEDVADLRRLYNACDLVLYPSEEEGFGFIPLEAAACGTPTVVADHPVFHETMGPNAHFIHDPRGRGVEAWADAITRALNGPIPARRLRRHARDFTWERAAREHAAVYQGVASA